MTPASIYNIIFIFVMTGLTCLVVVAGYFIIPRRDRFPTVSTVDLVKTYMNGYYDSLVKSPEYGGHALIVEKVVKETNVYFGPEFDKEKKLAFEYWGCKIENSEVIFIEKNK